MSDTPRNWEMVVYALSVLGGESSRVHTEDVALKCHELFPDSFSWTKYPQYPDKDIVRVALTDARKRQHGALVDGRSGQRRGQSARTGRRPVPDGWMLTNEGIDWLKRNLDRLTSYAASDHLKEHRQKLLKQLAKVKQHRLFVEYSQDPDGFVPSLGEIAELLRCRVDAAPDVWMARFESVRRKAQAADQETIERFVDKCEQAYIEQR